MPPQALAVGRLYDIKIRQAPTAGLYLKFKQTKGTFIGHLVVQETVMIDLHSDAPAVQRQSSTQRPLAGFLIHSRRIVPWLAGALVLAVLIVATGSVVALSPVAWVALIAVAPLTVVLVRQIQGACVDNVANRQRPVASTE